MGRVIHLAQYRKRRARTELQASEQPVQDRITIELQEDGTHDVTITGAYAATGGLALEAITDVLAYLVRTQRSAGAF